MKDVNGKAISTGTLIEGTLRSEDLIPEFAAELQRRNPSMLEAIKEGHKRVFTEWLIDSYTAEDENKSEGEDEAIDAELYEEASDCVSALQDALGEDLPDYVYFGNTEGDGSDFGYWVDIDRVNEAVSEKEITQVDDLPCDLILHVNDHGNATLYRVELHEIWGVV